MRKYLRELRLKKKASQKVTAEAIGLSQNYYSCIESGTRKASIDLGLLIKLSDYFEVDLDYLIKEEKALANMEGEQNGNQNNT